MNKHQVVGNSANKTWLFNYPAGAIDEARVIFIFVNYSATHSNVIDTCHSVVLILGEFFEKSF